jgi:acyl-ACP thioesterase
VAGADIDWVLLTDGGRLAAVPAAIEQLFAPGATFTPSRVRLPDPPEGAFQDRVTVRSSTVDPMGHMNNAAYLDLVDEAVAGVQGWPEAELDRRHYRIEYLRPALPGTTILVSAWRTGTGYAVSLREEDGEGLARSLVTTG